MKYLSFVFKLSTVVSIFCVSSQSFAESSDALAECPAANSTNIAFNEDLDASLTDSNFSQGYSQFRLQLGEFLNSLRDWESDFQDEIGQVKQEIIEKVVTFGNKLAHQAGLEGPLSALKGELQKNELIAKHGPLFIELMAISAIYYKGVNAICFAGNFLNKLNTNIVGRATLISIPLVTLLMFPSQSIVAIIGGGAATLFPMIATAGMMTAFPPSTYYNYEVRKLNEGGGIEIFFLTRAIVGPFLEEIVMRAGLQQLMDSVFQELSTSDLSYLSLSATAGIFGFLHYNRRYEFTRYQAVSAAVGGIVYGLAYRWYGFSGSFLAHAAHNMVPGEL